MRARWVGRWRVSRRRDDGEWVEQRLRFSGSCLRNAEDVSAVHERGWFRLGRGWRAVDLAVEGLKIRSSRWSSVKVDMSLPQGRTPRDQCLRTNRSSLASNPLAMKTEGENRFQTLFVSVLASASSGLMGSGAYAHGVPFTSSRGPLYLAVGLHITAQRERPRAHLDQRCWA